jgi:hypothetical protein
MISPLSRARPSAWNNSLGRPASSLRWKYRFFSLLFQILLSQQIRAIIAQYSASSILNQVAVYDEFTHRSNHSTCIGKER